MAVAYKDYYKVLGVDKHADAKAIKQAYRRLARKYHPDLKPGDKTAAERFKEANEAHEVLSDPEKRRRYDELGSDWAHYAERDVPGGGPRPDFGGFRVQVDREGDIGDFSEFFRTFFGDAATRPGGFGDGGTIDLDEVLGGRGGGTAAAGAARGARRGATTSRRRSRSPWRRPSRARRAPSSSRAGGGWRSRFPPGCGRAPASA